MRLYIERADREIQVIRVVGDLEGQEALALADVAAQTSPAPRRRVVDLTEMTFMDSSGLKALLMLATATRDSGGEIVLVLAPDAYARQLLEIRGVVEKFRIVATQADALVA
jgi:anti-sigma B factor antagonist